MHAVSFAVWIPGAVAVLATALLLMGLRGRRADEHPVCRRCGFDLFGKPDSTKVCGECGADLSGRRAARIGNRQRRRGMIYAAVPVLLACLGWEGVYGWHWARGTDWNQHKPAWWLVHEARGADPASHDAALAELARRISVATLPKEREAALVDEAFALQADISKPWVAGWGTLVETAHGAGRLDEDRWGVYLFQGFQLTLKPMQPIYRPCDRLEIGIVRGPDRVGALAAEPRWYSVGYHMPEERPLSHRRRRPPHLVRRRQHEYRRIVAKGQCH